MKKLILVATAACCISAPAYAQDDAELGGFKLGVVAGYDSTKLTIEDEAAVDSGSKSGFLYGLAAGYDYDLGKAVIGIESEISDSSMKIYGVESEDSDGDASFSASRELYVGARAGVAVTSNILLFAKAGYANGKFKERYWDGDIRVKESYSLDGYRLGAGAEFVKGQAFGRLEYRYTDYGKIKGDDPDFEVNVSTSRHQVVATAGVRF